MRLLRVSYGAFGPAPEQGAAPCLGSEPIEQGTAASFQCAACSEMAGVVKSARAGSTVDMGVPHGTKTYDRDAITIDYFLGTNRDPR